MDGRKVSDGRADSRDAAAAGASPILAVLRELHDRYRDDDSGTVASYIPELAKADPALFGIALATADGYVYETGDSRHEFTIQSVSKPFVYGLALAEHGRAFVLSKVGVEPSGEAFNSIVFDARGNRPFNPMVNAGAIATTALIGGDGLEERFARVHGLLCRCAGRRLAIDEAVFCSERQTGHRNRAIAWLERHFGMIDDRIDEHLDLYFRQCAILVTARDLAVMAATLANAGVNPLTAEAVLEPSCVRDVLSVMHSCGMYDYAGEWSFSVGLPAKSGVGGGIIAALPGQFGIGTFSPRLDERGNSCRGIRVCEDLSERLDLHVFAVHPPPAPVIRRHVSTEPVDPADPSGSVIAVYELQGDLYFATVERLLRQMQAEVDGLSCLILDGRRVGRLDASARRLLDAARETLAAAGKMLLQAEFPPAVAALLQAPADDPWPAGSIFADIGQARAWCKQQRRSAPAGDRGASQPATEADLFARLQQLGVPVETHRHPPVFTVAEARMLRGALPGQHTKNLFLKDKKGVLWLVVADEERAVDLKALRHRIGAAPLSFASAEVLRERLGVEPGSVTPFALINDAQAAVRVVLDAGMMAADILNFHPLANTATTAISPDGLIAFIRSCGHEPLLVAL